MANLEIVKTWFSKANADLRLARHIVTERPDFLEQALFHCQQSAEKAMKGFLAFHQIRFDKTHNLEKLIKQLAQVDPNFVSILSPAESLTRYVVAYRYPDADEEPVALSKAVNAIGLAEKVYDETSSRLPFEVFI